MKFHAVTILTDPTTVQSFYLQCPLLVLRQPDLTLVVIACLTNQRRQIVLLFSETEGSPFTHIISPLVKDSLWFLPHSTEYQRDKHWSNVDIGNQTRNLSSHMKPTPSHFLHLLYFIPLETISVSVARQISPTHRLLPSS